MHAFVQVKRTGIARSTEPVRRQSQLQDSQMDPSGAPCYCCCWYQVIDLEGVKSWYFGWVFAWYSQSGCWIWHRQSIWQVESYRELPGNPLEPSKSSMFSDFHSSSIFFVFPCFSVFFAAVDGLGWWGHGPDVMRNGFFGPFEGLVLLLLLFF